MKKPAPESDWPESWKVSYRYDLLEVFGDSSQPGYSYAYQNRFQATMRLIEEVLPKGSRILDVAGAQGNFSLALAEKGYLVTWNDLREELAGYVSLKHERGVVTYQPGNVFDLAFAHSFDAILAGEVIEHVAHPDEFLRKIAEFVRPGGYVVVTTPNGKYFRARLPRFSDHPDPSAFQSAQFRPDSDGHIFLIWPDEMRSFAKLAGLTVDRQLFLTNPLTNGHLKTHRVLPYLPRRLVAFIESATAHMPSLFAEYAMTATAVRMRKPASDRSN